MYGELFKLACLLHDVGHAPFLTQEKVFTWIRDIIMGSFMLS